MTADSIVLAHNPFSGRPSHADGYRPPSLMKLVGRDNVRETVKSLIQDILTEEENRNGIIVGSLGSSKTALREPILHMLEPKNLAELMEKSLPEDRLAEIGEGRMKVVPVWITQVDPEPRFKIPVIIQALRNTPFASQTTRMEWYAKWETIVKENSTVDDPNSRLMHAFNDFGEWLWQRGNLLLVFEDELERDVLSPGGTSEEVQVRQRKLQSMRSYFDSLNFPCGVFLLTTPEAYGIIMELHAALPHRFSPRFVVELQPLSWEDTKTLVAFDLSEAQRVPPDNPWAPFTENALRSVWEWSDGWVRWLNEALHAAIDEYRGDQVIDKKMVNRLLGRLRRPDELRSKLAAFAAGTIYAKVKRLVTFAEIDEASSRYHDLKQRQDALLEGFRILCEEKIYDFYSYERAMEEKAIVASFTPPEYATLRNAGLILIVALEKAEAGQVEAIRDSMYDRNADIALVLCLNAGDRAFVNSEAKKLLPIKGVAFSDILLTFELDDEIQRAIVLLSSMRGPRKDAVELINEELRVDKNVSIAVTRLFEEGLVVPALKTSTLQVYNYLTHRMADRGFLREEAVNGCYNETVDRQSKLREIKQIEHHPLEAPMKTLSKLSTNPLSRENIERAVEELDAYGVLDSEDGKLVTKLPRWEQRIAECVSQGSISRSALIERFYIVPKRARSIYQAIEALKAKQVVKEEDGEYVLRPLNLIKNAYEKYESALREVGSFSSLTYVQDSVKQALEDADQKWKAAEKQEDEISKRLALSHVLFGLDTILIDLVLRIYESSGLESLLEDLKETIDSLRKVREVPPTRLKRIQGLVTDAEKKLDSGAIVDAADQIFQTQAFVSILKSEVEERYALVQSAKQAICEAKTYAGELKDVAQMEGPLSQFLEAESELERVGDMLDISESAFDAGNFEGALASVREYAGRSAKAEALEKIEETITQLEAGLDELKGLLDRTEDSTLASVKSSYGSLNKAFEKLEQSRSLMHTCEEIAGCNTILGILEEAKRDFNMADQLARQAIIPRIRRVASVQDGMKEFNATLETVLDWVKDLMLKGEIADLKIIWSSEET